MYLAHPASGLTAAYLTRKVWNKGLNSKEQALLYASSIITATLPDFDVFYSIYKGIENHRYYITHKPLFYLAITGVILLISYLWNSKWSRVLRSFSFLFFLTTFVHILTDSIAGTMMFFYPFSDTIYRYTNVNSIFNVDNNILEYLTTPKLLLIELAFIVPVLYILFKKLKKDPVIFKWTSITFAIFSIMVFTGVIFFIIVL